MSLAPNGARFSPVPALCFLVPRCLLSFVGWLNGRDSGLNVKWATAEEQECLLPFMAMVLGIPGWEKIGIELCFYSTAFNICPPLSLASFQAGRFDVYERGSKYGSVSLSWLATQRLRLTGFRVSYWLAAGRWVNIGPLFSSVAGIGSGISGRACRGWQRRGIDHSASGICMTLPLPTGGRWLDRYGETGKRFRGNIRLASRVQRIFGMRGRVSWMVSGLACVLLWLRQGRYPLSAGASTAVYEMGRV